MNQSKENLIFFCTFVRFFVDLFLFREDGLLLTQQLRDRSEILNFSGIGAGAFGEGTKKAANLSVKVKRDRELTESEIAAVSKFLKEIGVRFSRPKKEQLITTADIRRVCSGAMKLAAIGAAAFGKDTAAFRTFKSKVTQEREISENEARGVMDALAALDTWIEHREAA